MVGAKASAYNAEIDGIFYNFSGETASVTNNNGNPGYQGNVVIPSSVTHNGNIYIVTSIGFGAFRDCSSLTSVSIPNSVTSIESSAFVGCTSLTSLIIPNSVTTIGTTILFGCTNIKTLFIPANVTQIGYGLLANTHIELVVVDPNNTIYDSRENCNGVIETATNRLIAGNKYTQIPESVKIIGVKAFQSSYDMNAVALPSGLTSIESDAFWYCEGLISLIIPEGVLTIEDHAFANCKSLESIELPKSLSHIGSGVLALCNNLTSIKVARRFPCSVNNDTFQSLNKGNITLYVPKGSKNQYASTEIQFGNYYSWNRWSGFKEVLEYGDNVQNNKIDFIDSKVKAICVEIWDLNGNGELDMEEASDIVTIGTLFKENTEITSFDELCYFTGISKLEDRAFANCSNLQSCTLPNSITTLEDCAFENCI
jgi:hypothetical protein